MRYALKVTFFDDPRRPPPEEEPQPAPAPIWIRAPENMLPGIAPLELLLARTDDTAVMLNQVRAYPTGFEFRITVLSRTETHDPAFRPYSPDRGDQLWLGIQFSDGSKATSLDVFPHTDDQPDPPVLVSGGGGGGGRHWDQDYWVWPLPPEGPFAFVVQWPARGIDVTRREIDAAMILEAAARAVELWPEDTEPHSGHGSVWRPLTVRMKPKDTTRGLGRRRRKRPGR